MQTSSYLDCKFCSKNKNVTEFIIYRDDKPFMLSNCCEACRTENKFIGRRCTRCGTDKVFQEFPLNRGKKYGLNTICRACLAARNRSNYKKRKPETVIKIDKNEYQNLDDYKKIYARKYYNQILKNKEKTNNNDKKRVACTSF